LYWGKKGFTARDLRAGRERRAAADGASILDFFSEPQRLEVAAEALGVSPVRLRRFVRLGWLVTEREGRRRKALLRVWKNNVASAHFHGAIRDAVYIRSENAVRKYLRERVDAERRPSPFKRYRGGYRRPLRSPGAAEAAVLPLGEALASRRTVRRFSRRPVAFEDFAAVVGGTWGRTGWIVDPVVGRLLTKTSPSSGSLHPNECYVLVWNVRGLPKGLYHYDVASDSLRRLRSGDFRRFAVRAASGQRWVGGAAFLCVLAPVFTRNLWKYQWDRAYRSIWLDAGHLAQTFVLLATARGLGPFTTAATQDSLIEGLIGLDGVREFPVYLCGAGVPAEPLLRAAR
jgi:SagB-type dehydrogenase family enzyme